MIATAIAAAYPDPVIGLGVQAVQVAVGIGQEIQERYRTNKFLTQANKDIFIPKGLYAMIVTYKTSSSEQPEVGVERVDLGATAVAKYGGDVQPDTAAAESGSSGKPKALQEAKEKLKQLRVASGETHGEAEMPVTCAPLIFPALDAAAAAPTAAQEGTKSEGVGSTLKAKSRSASKFVNDYYDRRAQASWVCSCTFSRINPPHPHHPIFDEISKYLTEESNEPNIGLSESNIHIDRSSKPRGAKVPIALCRPQQRNEHALLHADHRRQIQSRAVRPPFPPFTKPHHNAPHTCHCGLTTSQAGCAPSLRTRAAGSGRETRTRHQRAVEQASAAGERALSDDCEHADGGGVGESEEEHARNGGKESGGQEVTSLGAHQSFRSQS